MQILCGNITKIDYNKRMKKLFIIICILCSYSSFCQERFVNINWPRNRYVAEYHVQIYKDKDLTELVIEERVKKPTFKWRQVAPGTYYFRVAAKDKWNQLGDFSKASQLIVSSRAIETSQQLSNAQITSEAQTTTQNALADTNDQSFGVDLFQQEDDIADSTLSDTLENNSATSFIDEVSDKTKSGIANPLHFFLGFSSTYMSHQETDTSIDLNQVAGTFKLGASYDLSDRFDLGVVAFSNALVLSNDSETAADRQVTGFNIRSGLKLRNSSWKFSLGYYYWTVNSDRGDFSFFGPQVFVNYSLAIARPNFLYFKFAPLIDNETGFNTNNKEYAFGGGVSIINKDWFLTSDISILEFAANVDQGSVALANTTYSFGLQYNF